jgi:type II secretory pathway pseudopilin PulG
MSIAIRFFVNFNNSTRVHGGSSAAGFTLVEAVLAIALLGLGVATSVTALTKMNSLASMSRNATGASVVVQNEIDAILSNGPFNPQKNDPVTGQPLIPPELQIGTHPDKDVPIYTEKANNVIVWGKLRTIIRDASATYNGRVMILYTARVTVTYTYLNRTYSYSMDTVRASDI